MNSGVVRSAHNSRCTAFVDMQTKIHTHIGFQQYRSSRVALTYLYWASKVETCRGEWRSWSGADSWKHSHLLGEGACICFLADDASATEMFKETFQSWNMEFTCK